MHLSRLQPVLCHSHGVVVIKLTRPCVSWHAAQSHRLSSPITR